MYSYSMKCFKKILILLAVCFSGVFSANTPIKFCPPLKSATAILTCSSSDNNQADCGQPQREGSTAQIDCKPGFTAPRFVIPYKHITCQSSGQWNQPIYECVPDCGKPNVESGGRTSFPWHVAVYYKGNDETFQRGCGGTLIAPDVVLTAAHCLWDANSGSVKNVSQVRIVAGKHLKDWEDSLPWIQRRELREIKTGTFTGHHSSYVHDIALVILTEPVEITSKVNVACVNWDRNLVVRPGDKGVLAGWGNPVTQTIDSEISFVELPYVPLATCRNDLPPKVQALLTEDKFCTGYRNGSIGVCRGDSGGGLMVPYNGRHYVIGVPSVAFKAPTGGDGYCNTEAYTGITDVSYYIPWIQSNMPHRQL